MKADSENLLEPQWLLQQELARRCKKNARYSLRALANSLGLSHTVLSLALSGKRKLSKNACLKIADALTLSPEETKKMMNSRKPQKLESLPLVSPEILDVDTFAVISDWYHFAILSLLELPNSKLDSRWIAKSLGISSVEARLAIERLKRLKMISEKNGKWKQTTKSLKIDSTQSTAATRKFQKQILEKAIESMENDPIEKRDHTSITFTMDSKSVSYAKERIRQFRRELCAELESIGTPNSVFTISVQLFSMNQEKNKC